jgi:hypothetical protein
VLQAARADSSSNRKRMATAAPATMSPSAISCTSDCNSPCCSTPVLFVSVAYYGRINGRSSPFRIIGLRGHRRRRGLDGEGPTSQVEAVTRPAGIPAQALESDPGVRDKLMDRPGC